MKIKTKLVFLPKSIKCLSLSQETEDRNMYLLAAEVNYRRGKGINYDIDNSRVSSSHYSMKTQSWNRNARMVLPLEKNTKSWIGAS